MADFEFNSGTSKTWGESEENVGDNNITVETGLEQRETIYPGAGDDTIDLGGQPFGYWNGTFDRVKYDAPLQAFNSVTGEYTDRFTITLNQLLVSPMTLSVTEDVPEFELEITEGRALTGAGDRYRVTLTLTNASDFGDGDVEVTLNTASGFLTGLATDALNASDVVVSLGGVTVSDEIFIGQDTGSQSLLVGTMDFDVTVSDSVAPSSISDLVVTRVASDGIASVDTDIPGSTGDDVLYADGSSETVTGLAGDDSLLFAALEQLNSSSFDGGSGVDTVFVPGSRADYDYTEEGSVTTLFVSGNASQSVALTDVEYVRFNHQSTTTYVVTVASVDGANRYHIDGVDRDEFDLVQGNTYTFDLSSATTASHPLAFRTSDGSVYTTGVTSTGTLGDDMVVTFVVPDDAPSDLHY